MTNEVTETPEVPAMDNLEARAAEVVSLKPDGVQLARIGVLVTERRTALADAAAARERADEAAQEAKAANRRVEAIDVELEGLLPELPNRLALWADGVVDVDTNLAIARQQLDEFTGTDEQRELFEHLIGQLEESRAAQKKAQGA